MERFGIIPILLVLAGCASIISKSVYPVTIDSNPTGATIVITDDQGVRVFEGTTPTTVSLSVKKGFFSGRNYTIQASLAGHQSMSLPIARSIDGWYFANLLFGGVIGMLIVDPATGAMWKLEERVVVTLMPSDAVETDSELALRILSLDDLPEQYRDQLVPIRVH